MGRTGGSGRGGGGGGGGGRGGRGVGGGLSKGDAFWESIRTENLKVREHSLACHVTTPRLKVSFL